MLFSSIVFPFSFNAKISWTSKGNWKQEIFISNKKQALKRNTALDVRPKDQVGVSDSRTRIKEAGRRREKPFIYDMQ